MLLAIDIGNSSISVGVFDISNKNSPKILFDFKITSRDSSADEYTILLKDFLSRNLSSDAVITAAAISSVVPSLTDKFKHVVSNICGTDPFVITNGIRTGFSIKIRNPEQLGTDIVCNVAGALISIDAPIVIIDMGTATTLTVVDTCSNLIGTIIIPGIKISMDALYSSAAQIGDISLSNELELIGKDTKSSISSGIINGNAFMIDGFLRNIREELNIKESGVKLSLIATGGLSELILPHLRNKFSFDKNLTLHGLAVLYCKNHKY